MIFPELVRFQKAYTIKYWQNDFTFTNESHSKNLRFVYTFLNLILNYFVKLSITLGLIYGVLYVKNAPSIKNI